jgi:hypothetical protein
MTKLTTSQLLKEAKQYLWNGRNSRADEDNNCIFICHSIDRVKERLSFKRVDAIKYHALIREIDSRLASKKPSGRVQQNTLKSWLVEVAGLSWSDVMNDVAVQKHRRDWMNMLIAEYQSKGD